MAIIEHDLLPKQKLQKRNLKVKVDLYPYATELYDELLAMGIKIDVRKVPTDSPENFDEILKKAKTELK